MAAEIATAVEAAAADILQAPTAVRADDTRIEVHQVEVIRTGSTLNAMGCMARRARCPLALHVEAVAAEAGVAGDLRQVVALVAERRAAGEAGDEADSTTAGGFLVEAPFE